MAKKNEGLDDAIINGVDKAAGSVIDGIDAIGDVIFGSSSKPQSKQCTCKCQCTCND